MKSTTGLVLTILCLPSLLSAAEPFGLKSGAPALQSAGALAFGPEDILFVGDTKSAAVFAIATGDLQGEADHAAFVINDIGAAVNDVCGSEATINDLAVNPRPGTTFLSATTKHGPAICRIDTAGKLSLVSLEDIPFASVTLPDAPEDKLVGRGRRKRNPRNDAITDIAFYEGRILVSGLRSGNAPSSVREFSFPFSSIDRGTGIAIYHAAHGKEEDYSAARTFVTLMIDGKPNLLAAYTCTPLVKIPLGELRDAQDSVQGTTVAELGNWNRPLDMISYSNDSGEYLLLSNSNRGVMKIATSGLDDAEGLATPVRGGKTAGHVYETIDSLKGVVQMDKLNDSLAIVLMGSDDGMSLKTVALP